MALVAEVVVVVRTPFELIITISNPVDDDETF